MIFCCGLTLMIPHKILLADNNLFQGSIYKVQFSKSNPTEDVLRTFDAFCLEKTGVRTELPNSAIKQYQNANKSSFKLYDLGSTECPVTNSLHLMGHRFFTGAGSRVHVLVYADANTWISVWFHATEAEIVFTEQHDAYIQAFVHPLYCPATQDQCKIAMKIPYVSERKK